MGLEVLSARQREVFDALGLGLGDKEIAAKLGISTKTIASYVTRMRVRLGVASLRELVVLAVESRLQTTRGL